MECTVISALKTFLISDDFPERDCNKVETKVSINARLSISCAHLPNNEDSESIGKIHELQGDDEESNSLEVFGENFPQ